MNFKKLLNTAYHHCSPISDIKPVNSDLLLFIFSSFAGRTIVVFDELLNPVSFEQYFSSMYIRKITLQHTQDQMVRKTGQSSPSTSPCNKYTGGPDCRERISKYYAPGSLNELSLFTPCFGCKHRFLFFSSLSRVGLLRGWDQLVSKYFLFKFTCWSGLNSPAERDLIIIINQLRSFCLKTNSKITSTINIE